MEVNVSPLATVWLVPDCAAAAVDLEASAGVPESAGGAGVPEVSEGEMAAGGGAERCGSDSAILCTCCVSVSICRDWCSMIFRSSRSSSAGAELVSCADAPETAQRLNAQNAIQRHGMPDSWHLGVERGRAKSCLAAGAHAAVRLRFAGAILHSLHARQDTTTGESRAVGPEGR
jgi:hypothetical protein